MYRKLTFTELSTKFNSAISNSYKYNLILCLLDRAYKICSTYLNFTDEIENIRKYFGQNGYPFNMVEKCIKTKLDSLFIHSIPNTDVPL